MKQEWQNTEKYMALLEDVSGEATAYGHAIQRQYNRIYEGAEPLREYTAIERAPQIEFHFLITGLWRVRSLLAVLKSTGRCGGASSALDEFDKLLPSLKNIRDTLEHYDERLLGRAWRQTAIERSGMRSWILGNLVVWLNAGVIAATERKDDEPVGREDLCLNLDAVPQATNLAIQFMDDEMSRTLAIRDK